MLDRFNLFGKKADQAPGPSREESPTPASLTVPPADSKAVISTLSSSASEGDLLDDDMSLLDMRTIYRNAMVSKDYLKAAALELGIEWGSGLPKLKCVADETKSFISQGKIVRFSDEKEDQYVGIDKGWNQFLGRFAALCKKMVDAPAYLKNDKNSIASRANKVNEIIQSLPGFLNSFHELGIHELLGLKAPEPKEIKEAGPSAEFAILLSEEEKRQKFKAEIRTALHLEDMQKSLSTVLQSLEDTFLLGDQEAAQHFADLSPLQQEAHLIRLHLVNFLLMQVYVIFDKLELRFPLQPEFLASSLKLQFTRHEEDHDPLLDQKVEESPQPTVMSLLDVMKRTSAMITNGMSVIGACADNNLLYPYAASTQYTRTVMLTRVEEKLENCKEEKINTSLAKARSEAIKLLQAYIDKKHDDTAYNKFKNAVKKAISSDAKKAKREAVKGLLDQFKEFAECHEAKDTFVREHFTAIEKCFEVIEEHQATTPGTLSLKLAIEKLFQKTRVLAFRHSVGQQQRRHLQTIMTEATLKSGLQDEATFVMANRHGGLTISVQDSLRQLASGELVLATVKRAAQEKWKALRVMKKEHGLEFLLRQLAAPELKQQYDALVPHIKTFIRELSDDLASIYEVRIQQNAVKGLHVLNQVTSSLQKYKVDTYAEEKVQTTNKMLEAVVPEYLEGNKDKFKPMTTFQKLRFIIKRRAKFKSLVKSAPMYAPVLKHQFAAAGLDMAYRLNAFLKTVCLILDRYEIEGQLAQGFFAEQLEMHGFSLAKLAALIPQQLKNRGIHLSPTDVYPYTEAKLEMRAKLKTPTNALTQAILTDRQGQTVLSDAAHEAHALALAQKRETWLLALNRRLAELKASRDTYTWFFTKARAARREEKIAWIESYQDAIRPAGVSAVEADDVMEVQDAELYKKHKDKMRPMQIALRDAMDDELKTQPKEVQPPSSLKEPLLWRLKMQELLRARIENINQSVLARMTDAGKKKMALLRTLVNKLNDHSLHDALKALRREDKQYYLLFEGYTGKLLTALQGSQLSVLEMVDLIQAQITSLRDKKLSLFTPHRAERIRVLQDWQRRITANEPGFKLLVKSEVDLLIQYHGILYAQWEAMNTRARYDITQQRGVEARSYFATTECQSSASSSLTSSVSLS